MFFANPSSVCGSEGAKAVLRAPTATGPCCHFQSLLAEGDCGILHITRVYLCTCVLTPSQSLTVLLCSKFHLWGPLVSWVFKMLKQLRCCWWNTRGSLSPHQFSLSLSPFFKRTNLFGRQSDTHNTQRKGWPGFCGRLSVWVFGDGRWGLTSKWKEAWRNRRALNFGGNCGLRVWSLLVEDGPRRPSVKGEGQLHFGVCWVRWRSEPRKWHGGVYGIPGGRHRLFKEYLRWFRGIQKGLSQWWSCAQESPSGWEWEAVVWSIFKENMAAASCGCSVNTLSF